MLSAIKDNTGKCYSLFVSTSKVEQQAINLTATDGETIWKTNRPLTVKDKHASLSRVSDAEFLLKLQQLVSSPIGCDTSGGGAGVPIFDVVLNHSSDLNEVTIKARECIDSSIRVVLFKTTLQPVKPNQSSTELFAMLNDVANSMQYISAELTQAKKDVVDIVSSSSSIVKDVDTMRESYDAVQKEQLSRFCMILNSKKREIRKLRNSLSAGGDYFGSGSENGDPRESVNSEHNNERDPEEAIEQPTATRNKRNSTTRSSASSVGAVLWNKRAKGCTTGDENSEKLQIYTLPERLNGNSDVKVKEEVMVVEEECNAAHIPLKRSTSPNASVTAVAASLWKRRRPSNDTPPDDSQASFSQAAAGISSPQAGPRRKKSRPAAQPAAPLTARPEQKQKHEQEPPSVLLTAASDVLEVDSSSICKLIESQQGQQQQQHHEPSEHAMHSEDPEPKEPEEAAYSTHSALSEGPQSLIGPSASPISGPSLLVSAGTTGPNSGTGNQHKAASQASVVRSVTGATDVGAARSGSSSEGAAIAGAGAGAGETTGPSMRSRMMARAFADSSSDED